MCWPVTPSPSTGRCQTPASLGKPFSKKLVKKKKKGRQIDGEHSMQSGAGVVLHWPFQNLRAIWHIEGNICKSLAWWLVVNGAECWSIFQWALSKSNTAALVNQDVQHGAELLPLCLNPALNTILWVDSRSLYSYSWDKIRLYHPWGRLEATLDGSTATKEQYRSISISTRSISVTPTAVTIMV